MYTESDIANLRAVIKNSGRAVFFGGAGVSTESGIPDFRSEDGLYRQKYKYPPETMLSSEFFWSHTEEFYDFYRDKMLVTDVSPNAAHDKLAEWEREGHISAIVTPVKTFTNCTAVFTATSARSAKCPSPCRGYKREKECRAVRAAGS